MFTPQDRERCAQLYEKYYGGRKFHDALYRDLINTYLHPGERLLDAGCGRHMTFSKEFSPFARVVGIDLDSTFATDNRRAPFGIRGDLSHLPFASGYFDMVISRSVVEHLEDPLRVFQEFSRVLRPGGKAVILTPNKYDYVSLVAAVTPYRVHRRLVNKIFGVSEDDVFPTLYRANTIRSLRKLFAAAGFAPRELRNVTHYPAYLMFSPLLFRIGALYERLTSLERLASLRSVILCVFEKQGKPTLDNAPAHVSQEAEALSAAVKA